MKNLGPKRARVVVCAALGAIALALSGCSTGAAPVSALSFMKGDWACAVTIPQNGQPSQTLKATVEITAEQATLTYASTGTEQGTTRQYPFTTKGTTLTAHPVGVPDSGWVVTLPANVDFGRANTVHVVQKAVGWDVDVSVTASADTATFTFSYPNYAGKISYSCKRTNGSSQ